MNDKLKNTVSRLESVIADLRWRSHEEVALIISKNEADEIIGMISSGMSAWEVQQLRNNYTDLIYKGYRLLVV